MFKSALTKKKYFSYMCFSIFNANFVNGHDNSSPLGSSKRQKCETGGTLAVGECMINADIHYTHQ